MKSSQLTWVIFLLLSLASCKDKYAVDSYFDSSVQDSLLADIVTYIYAPPPGADWQTRFHPEYRKYYVSILSEFRFEKLYKDNDSYYFFIIRPARSTKGNIRGVGGQFRLNEAGRIVSFNEVFNTPAATLPELQLRGVELFKWMIKEGNVNAYLKNQDYIEWPNEWTYYDTIRHEWLVRPGV